LGGERRFLHAAPTHELIVQFRIEPPPTQPVVSQ
jgi:hypothetical protein